MNEKSFPGSGTRGNLQRLAESWGLVDELGQDEVQRLIAFVPAAPEPVTEVPGPGYADRILAQWEADDQRRPPAPAARRPEYRPARATIDAFWYVVSLDDPEYLARWLAQHPADAPLLHEIWERKCATAA